MIILFEQPRQENDVNNAFDIITIVQNNIMSIYARVYFIIIYSYVKRMTHTREQWTPQAMRRTKPEPD